jgi:MFS family permease
VSLVFALAGFLYFALGIVSGPLADRWGPRVLSMLGMALLGLGLALAGAARTLDEVYLAYGLGVGIGIGCAYVPVIAAVQKWFVKRRGLASGLAVSGIGVGTLVMPPLAALLIENFGWRRSYLALGIGAAVVGMAMASLIRRDPAALGLAPDGAPAAAAGDNHLAGLKVREAVFSASFASLYAACFASAFAVFVPFVHLVPYALDRGVDPNAAAILIGLIGVGSTLGRFVLGGVADRIGRQRFIFLTYIGMALCMALWAAATELVGLASFALVFGLIYGGWVAILPAAVMDRFGGLNVSGILGILYTSVAFGTLIGPSAAGYLFDVSGSYTTTILCCLGANLLAAAITAASIRTKRSTL